MSYVRIRYRTSAYDIVRQHTMSYVSIRCRTSVYDVVRQHTMSYVSIRCRTSAYDVVCDMAIDWSMGAGRAAGVAGISPSRACRLFWHGCSRFPKHVVLSFWTSLRVSIRTKSPGQTAHVISAQRAPSTLPPARACVRSAHARMRALHARSAHAILEVEQSARLRLHEITNHSANWCSQF
jgi:hypothetical protein